MSKPPRNLARPFAIAGFIFGEVYMLFVALGPNLKDAAVPWQAYALRIAVLALFLGPFGAAAGTGVGLLATGFLGLVQKLRQHRETPPGRP